MREWGKYSRNETESFLVFTAIITCSGVADTCSATWAEKGGRSRESLSRAEKMSSTFIKGPLHESALASAGFRAGSFSSSISLIQS